MPIAADLTGKRFGRLIALRVETVTMATRKRRGWRCACDCGKEIVTQTGHLTSGHTVSCGCVGAEQGAAFLAVHSRRHGERGSVEYALWRSMNNRCFNSRDKGFPNYGGRGVTVCDRWRIGEEGKHPFACFLEDMGRRPSPELSIDREDNDGNYDPGNCRWATVAQQNQNSRGAKLTMEYARAIRASSEPTRALAQRYGVSETIILGVKNNTRWKEAA